MSRKPARRYQKPQDDFDAMFGPPTGTISGRKLLKELVKIFPGAKVVSEGEQKAQPGDVTEYGGMMFEQQMRFQEEPDE